LALNLWFSCLSLPSAGIIHMCHHEFSQRTQFSLGKAGAGSFWGRNACATYVHACAQCLCLHALEYFVHMCALACMCVHEHECKHVCGLALSVQPRNSEWIHPLCSQPANQSGWCPGLGSLLKCHTVGGGGLLFQFQMPERHT
jgi:hypothetical protein